MRNLKSQISKIKRTTRGFTLIETLVAVLLLTTAIAGPLTIAAKGLSAALIARDQMVAFYLAQDAVEYVRFVRDSNKLAGTAWLNGLSTCSASGGCQIDPFLGLASVTGCPSGCAPLNKYDDGAGHKYFSYTSGTQTPQRFVRTIAIALSGTNEAVLSVTVSWRAMSGVTRSILVRENLFDWQ